MTIPSEILALIDRLYQELNETEQELISGLNRVRPLLSIFPDNNLLMGYFSYFNNVLFFIDSSRRRIQSIIETIEPADAQEELIQEAGEDLGEQLGRVIEAKMGVRRIMDTLEELP
jgi:hypothetical protein